MTAVFGALQRPITLGPVGLAGRVVSTSHQTSLVEDHLPSEDLLAYHEARAAGGVAAIFLEAAAVHPSGLLSAHTIGGYLPPIVERYQALARGIGAHGTRVFVQLFHGGREQFGTAPRPAVVAPSAIPSARFKSEPRALTGRELSEIVSGYATAARLAREGGLDGVELSFSHGYLVAQFLSPTANRRTDGYGGDSGARLRLAREIIAVVRDAAGPSLAVGVRLSANELGRGMLGREACAEVGRELCRNRELDFVSLVLGNSSTYGASTWIAPPPPVPAAALADEIALIRVAVAPTPVIAATRIVDLVTADELVGSGRVDLVGMTRALIADPDLLRKAARDEPVIECVGCNQGCIGHYHQGATIACAVNPRTGRERHLPRRVRAQRRERVVIIGGGPAGVAAAMEAARRGHLVLLHERDSRLGGQLALAGRAPAHRELFTRWERTMTAQLRHHRVEVRFDSELTAPPGEGWDRVILATGADPYRPAVPDGDDGKLWPTVSDAWSAIAHPETFTGPVLIADWGGEWSGLDAAERLRGAGHEVTLACAAVHPGETLHQYQRNLYLARLDQAGIPIIHHAELDLSGEEPALRHAFSGRSLPRPRCATVIIAHGRAPRDALWPALETLPGTVRAGDVLSPRTLEEAVLDGTRCLDASIPLSR